MMNGELYHGRRPGRKPPAGQAFYGKAKHSFTNPDADKAGMAPVGYDKTADERSWREMTGFLKEVLAGK